MLSKNELKYIQSLCQKKQRQQEGLFIAEGTRLVDELLQSGYLIRKIYSLPDWIAEHPAVSAEVQQVSEAELQKISLLQTPHQVLAIAAQKYPGPLPAESQAFTLVVDGIQDPGNFGTIIRIADWFGIRQIIASEDTVELYNPKVIQATMGSFIRVEVYYAPLEAYLQNCRLPIYGALLNGKSLYEQVPISEAVLVIGNEGKGIRESLLPLITHPITIPRIGGAESLNAAVAAGIIVSHLRMPVVNSQ
jgi:TrmH family RNA methyltransferase